MGVGREESGSRISLYKKSELREEGSVEKEIQKPPQIQAPKLKAKKAKNSNAYLRSLKNQLPSHLSKEHSDESTPRLMIIETLRQKVEATEKVAAEGGRQIKVFHLPEKQTRIN